MKKQKIAHLVSLKTVGGVENFFSNFVAGSHDTFEHHVFLSADEVNDFYIEKLKDNGVFLHSLRRYRGFYLPKKPKFFRQRLHRSLFEKHGLRHIVLWNKLEKFPIHIPANVKKIHFERGSAWLAKGRSEITEHLKSCHAILSNTQGGLNVLDGRWGLDPHVPQYVFYNGLNPSYETTLNRTKKLSSDAVSLGFAGRFVPLKGWIIALLTLRNLRDKGVIARLVVAGKGRQKELFSKLVEDWDLADFVEDMGLLKDMSKFFERVDIFLHTSLREPFGNVAVEAQAHGCPVIAGVVDGNAEIIKDDHTGYLITMDYAPSAIELIDESLCNLPEWVWDPFLKTLRKPMFLDPQKVALKIEQMMSEPEQYESMSRAARDFVLETYSFNSRIQKLKEGLVKCLEDF